MATTTNFNWETPDDTDLVKDGAAAIRTALNGVDTSFVDLKGGTTGQVLSKASGTDLDFTWVAQDDSNAIQNAIVDAKGDLISATAADTPARLAVGTNGQVLTADSTAATGIKWATPNSGGGLVFIGSSTFSASSAPSINNCFTSTYRNYKIVINLDSTSSAASQMAIRLRASGTDATGANYFSWGFEPNSTSSVVYNAQGNGVTIGCISYQGNYGTNVSIDVWNPALAQTTHYATQYACTTNAYNMIGGTYAGSHVVSTAYDGFTIIPNGGTVTGTIRVYGYANS